MKNKIIYIVIGLLVVGGIIGLNFYQKIYGKAVTQDAKIYIKSNSTLDDVTQAISPYIKNTDNFEWVANKKKYNTPKGGMYVLKKGMNLNSLVNMLRIGNQTPIKVSFNNQNTLENLAGRIAQQVEADSLSLLSAMRDSAFLAENDFNEKTVLGMYIPNQYEFYWNTSAESFRDRMLKEYNRFWNTTRLNQATKLGLTEGQVIALASIVQKETAKKDERPLVAGLYLNRLKSGWPLQADPTIIYCLKEKYGQDTVIKRVLNKDLTINSPYNTYKNIGLPPSLIAMPDVTAIDAVLNPAQHNYYYMCASVEKIGYHEFATSLSQHNRNAAKYQRWISQQGINR
ncbi:endolytic transglycosylase MltG [Tenacibaculum sp. IB213877]|uniref:endolytic transglycosylase MltG n=1 Tax=Tenacibaculum sp. IB213877 TaxID=3097351 RepID=UPI002A5AAABF|nr:endolytic transglycosylase MltG [Tenacibaculum sp. IB213877]MDY0779186.1 endolytic transglycosylase MltG [Tenacibaculum sp. IB213877]